MGPVYEKYAATPEMKKLVEDIQAHRVSDPAGGGPPPSATLGRGPMQHRLHGIARVLGALSNAALWIASIGMIAMTAMVALQVFSRYVLNSSPSWTEAASIMVMSWFIFLGAAVGVRENFHMGFDVLVHFLPDGAAPWMRAISDLAVLVFALGMVVYGLQLTIDTWTATIPVLAPARRLHLHADRRRRRAHDPLRPRAPGAARRRRQGRPRPERRRPHHD